MANITRRSAAAVLLAGGVFGLQAQQPAPPAPGKTRGSVMAPLKLELFSDFQCPACKQLHDQTLKPLIEDYVNKGKIYLIYREFPLPMHQFGRAAASLAVAAARIGKYEAVADMLFASQDTWSKTGQPEAALSLPAADLEKVKKLSKSPEVAAEIDRETELGKKAGVNQTPTMIFTYKGRAYPIGGYVSYAILRRFVDDILTR